MRSLARGAGPVTASLCDEDDDDEKEDVPDVELHVDLRWVWISET